MPLNVIYKTDLLFNNVVLDMKTKNTLFTLALLISLGLTEINLCAQELSAKLTELRIKNESYMILDKTVRVRYKVGYNYSNIPNNSLQSNSVSGTKIFPMLPYQSSFTNNKSLLKARVDSKKKVNEKALLETENKVLRTFIIQYTEEMTPPEYCQYLLRTNSDVEIAEPYFVEKLMGIPNDPMLGEQNTLQRIKALPAWQNGLEGADTIVIGISDSGMDITHEDIKDNIAINQGEIPANGLDDDGNGYIDDYNGYNFAVTEQGYLPYKVKSLHYHGMHVAGIIGATTNNAVGIAGIGYKCKIFPLKITVGGDDDGRYGYQSIIYAAKMGFDVLNCSWGMKKPYSEIEQSVIDYAISSGVSIVASSGNIVGSVTVRSVCYPAGYRGVLGVGEVDYKDEILYSSTISAQTDVMAPGEGNASLENAAQGYVNTSNGTSFASPVVAGFVGLIRSKYPQLNAIQAIEFARICTDDISGVSNNIGHKFYLPGRINIEKASISDPFALPSIRPLQPNYSDAQGNTDIRLRDYTGIINFDIDAYNYLGAADKLTFKLSVDGDNAGIKIEKSTVVLQNIASNHELEINGFEFRIVAPLPTISYFRVDISSTDGFKDFFIIPFTDINDITTFENDSVIFSVSDYGLFGTSANRDFPAGQGFSVKGVDDLLYKGGLVSLINSYDLSTSLFNDGEICSDYLPIKKLISPDSNVSEVSVIFDYKPRYNIISKFTLIGNKPLLRIDVDFINKTAYTLGLPSIAYIFDWDMGALPTNNKAEYFSEAIPENANPYLQNISAEIVYSVDENVYIGGLVFTANPSARAQTAGFTENLFSASSMSDIMISGKEYQTSTTGDMAMAIGMLYESVLAGEQEKFYILIGYSNNRDSLAKMLKDEYGNILSVNDNVSKYSNVNIYPNPAKSEVYIEFDNELVNSGILEVFNLNGEKLFEVTVDPMQNNIKLDIKNLSKGTYYLNLDNKAFGSFIKE